MSNSELVTVTPAQVQSALDRLKIPAGNRRILCLDGGGIRGVLTLQLLKRLEQIAEIPCYRLFDMVAGTSTGGIIAGLIASGHTADHIETLYDALVTKVFSPRSWLANRFLNPPNWTKAEYRKYLKQEIGDQRIGETCTKVGIDLLITAHDLTEGEETYFSFLRGRSRDRNVYRDVLLRSAMEATMSAPTFFNPLERFVDGGTTTFNNPALAAIIEAVAYGGDGASQYTKDKLTVMSFGTGCRTQSVEPQQADNPPGTDVFWWLNWLMTESGNDASDMQSYLLRARNLLAVDYRRFQIALDQKVMERLPNHSLESIHATAANCLHDLTDKELSTIDLDNVAYFPVMKAIGEAMAEYICGPDSGHNGFTRDLLDQNRKECLVIRAGEKDVIARHLSDPDWLDGTEP